MPALSPRAHKQPARHSVLQRAISFPLLACCHTLWRPLPRRSASNLSTLLPLPFLAPRCSQLIYAGKVLKDGNVQLRDVLAPPFDPTSAHSIHLVVRTQHPATAASASSPAAALGPATAAAPSQPQTLPSGAAARASTSLSSGTWQRLVKGFFLLPVWLVSHWQVCPTHTASLPHHHPPPLNSIYHDPRCSPLNASWASD